MPTAAPPLGRLSATSGPKAEQRFSSLAQKAWLTRKISVLLPTAGLDQELLVAKLQQQRHHYVLEDVPLESLGEPSFVAALEERQIACLSRGARGLDSGDVLALWPSPPRLGAALSTCSFQRLGLEEPLPGAGKLEQKFLPCGQRHVFVDLPVSKTRAKRAAKLAQVPRSRWQELVEPLQETASFMAYCGKEADAPYDFAPLKSATSSIQCMEVPIQCRGISLGADARRPGFQQLVEPWRWSDAKGGLGNAFGRACEDFLDWVGALHLGLPYEEAGDLWEATEDTAISEEVMLWTMGESLMGPRQIAHALQVCQSTLGPDAAGWFLLSVWGAEDGPISHHGGAHSFDLTGACHAHLLQVSGKSLLLEAANALHSNA
ncbi:unnamed protein product [Effrenium voratum]|uniref:Uncharacterized protein n=1 Tax=Effrenium voratum TaxID=2562239 RepID=A0AA36JNL4_9DINO|nr:unnamed protein product [Effrenium voratum]CAJ1422938.1 unnamed protein product [Effrenium voratum]